MHLLLSQSLLGKGAGYFPSLSPGKQRQKVFKNIVLGHATLHHSLFRHLLWLERYLDHLPYLSVKHLNLFLLSTIIYQNICTTPVKRTGHKLKYFLKRRSIGLSNSVVQNL